MSKPKCQGYYITSGNDCRSYAVKGSDYCKQHQPLPGMEKHMLPPEKIRWNRTHARQGELVGQMMDCISKLDDIAFKNEDMREEIRIVLDGIDKLLHQVRERLSE